MRRGFQLSMTSLSNSCQSVQKGVGIVRAAVRTIRSEAALGPRQTNTSLSKPAERPYVSHERIAELRAINSSDWDLRKLIRLCEELNAAYQGGNYLSVAMLLRAIADHVPPISTARTRRGGSTGSVMRRRCGGLIAAACENRCPLFPRKRTFGGRDVRYVPLADIGLPSNVSGGDPAECRA